MYTISSLKTDIERKIHSTTVDKISTFNELVYEAARNVLARTDPAETRRTVNFEKAMYDNALRYLSPTDLKGDKILSIRPQTNKTWMDRFKNVYGNDFDNYRSSQTFSVEFDSGVKYIRASKALPKGSTLDLMNTVADNGSWNNLSDTSNLTVDTVNYLNGASSLKFDLNPASTSGYIENSTLESQDYTNYENLGVGFVSVYIPDATTITAINLRWGSSAANYWNKTVTAAHDSTVLRNGWNLLRFDWDSATAVGTPDSSDITYARLTFTHDTAGVTGVRLNGIFFELGRIYELVYYSKYLFRDGTTGAWKESPTDDGDIVNLDTDSYNVLLYETALLVAQELQGEDSAFDVKFWERQKKNAWDDYEVNHPSEAIPKTGTYYRMPNRTRGINGWIYRPEENY